MERFPTLDDLALLFGSAPEPVVLLKFANPLNVSSADDALEQAARTAEPYFANPAAERAGFCYPRLGADHSSFLNWWLGPLAAFRAQWRAGEWEPAPGCNGYQGVGHLIGVGDEWYGWMLRFSAEAGSDPITRVEALVESENAPLVAVEFATPLPARVTSGELLNQYMDARITSCSDSAGELFATPPSHMLHRRVRDLELPLIERMLRESFPAQSAETPVVLGETTELHVEVHEPDYQAFRLKPTFIASTTGNGELIYREAWLRITDITTASLEIRARRRADQTRRLAMEAAELYAFEADLENGTVTLDRRGLDAMDLPNIPQDLAGWLELFSFDRLNVTKPSFDRFVRERTGPLNFIARLDDRHGNERHVELWGIAATNDSGHNEAMGLYRDVTESHRLRERLQEKKTLESLGVLAGGVAHDFNNLLMSVLGYAELLDADLAGLHGVPDDRRFVTFQRNTDEIRRAALRASELCTSLLAYAGEHPLEMRDHDLTALVRSTAELLEVTTGKQVPIRLHLEPDVIIRGDQGQLTQVIMNLVGNAADAMRDRPGAIDLSVAICDLPEAELEILRSQELPIEDNHYACLTVQDEGCGMSAETLQRMFEPFFTTKTEGRGLGMAAVHGIVRHHQGAILVDSVENRGTCFRLFFPLRPALPRVNDNPPAPIVGKDSARVLLVDDEDDVRTIAGEMLRHLGCSVIEASNAEQALELARHATLDCALVDITMPGMSGSELAQRLLDITPELRVVLSSGYTEYDLPQLLLEKCPFIHKPYTLADIARVLDLGSAPDPVDESVREPTA